tara:strand:+ start:710 stop:979 length:270 start_codon:yes stop_codon:yes gene_type:complete
MKTLTNQSLHQISGGTTNMGFQVNDNCLVIPIKLDQDIVLYEGTFYQQRIPKGTTTAQLICDPDRIEAIHADHTVIMDERFWLPGPFNP